MLNTLRRAPPPPLRLFSPTGVEREAQMDETVISPPNPYIEQANSSEMASPAQTSTSSSEGSLDSRMDTISRASSSSTLCTAFEEHALPIKIEEQRPTYYDLRMRWCNRPFVEQQDSLPTSVSLESFLPSPTSPSYGFTDMDAASWSSKEGLDKATPGQNTIDWLSKLTESSLRMEGEVLLFLQSEEDPRMKSVEQ